MTTNAQKAKWLQDMEAEVEAGGGEEGHIAGDEILLEIARATGHGAIADAFDRMRKWYA